MSEHTLCLYAQFLAYSFHSARSVRNYLSGIRTLHVLAKVPPPNLKDIEIRLTLMGLNKTLAKPVKQAQPITPEIMIDILGFLDLNNRSDLVFWGILVIGFFGMLRKSNLVPDTKDSFDPNKQLTRNHVIFKDKLAILRVTWSKTLQFKQKLLEIPLFAIRESPLCPVTVLQALCNVRTKGHYPLFGTGKKPTFTYHTFHKKFRKMLKKAGYREKLFSSHSLRRGSVSFCHKNGIPESLIQVHGDWASDCYKRYLDFPLEVRAIVSLKMREGIRKAGL